MKNSKLLLGLSSLLILMLHTGATWAATAGYVQFVNGSVSLTTPKGATHALQKGEAVSEGDTVNTAQNASAQIRMQDGGFIAVRPDTRLKFDSFKFTGKTGQPESSFFSLFRGGFRAVTGLIGRVNKQDYRINTPAATIGIRGTDHETIYLPANISGAMAGAYSKVNIGETTLTTNRGTINVLPNQMGFAGGLNQAPQLQPINTTIFTVAVAPREVKVAKEDKSDNKGQDSGQSRQAVSDEKKDAAATKQEQRPEAEASSEKAPAAPEPIRGTAVTDNTKLAANINTTVTATVAVPESTIETVAVTPLAPPTTVLPVTASSGALTLDATAQTVASGGSTVSVQTGIYSTQAQTAADAARAAAQTAATVAAAAASAKTALLAIATVSTTPATTAIGTASTAVGTTSSGATLAVNNALALTPANATTAANNVTSAQAVAATAATQAAAAQTALTANGAFADTTAVTANSVINTATTGANALVQAAYTTVQTNATAVTSQNTALTNAQTAASTALSSANSSLATANSTLGSAGTQNTAITTAQSSATALLSAAQTAAAAANTAALAAQAAATQAASLQSAGDLTGAAAQLAIAQQQQAIAQQQLVLAQNANATLANQIAAAQAAQTTASNAVTSAVSVATTATTAASTAQTQAANAGSAASAANGALAQTVAATTGTAANTLQTQAGIVAANAPIAAYNNPAVASSNFIGHLAMPAPVTGGYHIAQENNNSQQAHTNFVLDGNGNLVEMRSTSFQVQPVQSSPTTSLANADVKWSGGTAADTLKLADNSMYAGRWVGATVTVTDLAATPVAPFLLTPANSLWTVLLTPNSGYVQSLVGTTSYTKIAATQPFDASGILGTLTNASLSADFTNQLVSATLNLTMPAGSMAGSYAVTANNMPINTVTLGNGAGFGGNTMMPTVSCIGTCAAGAGGYSANVGGSFAGTAAASAGLGYDIWPTVGTNLPATNLVQGLVAFTATAPTPGTNPALGTYYGGVNRSIIVGGGVFKAETPAVAVNYALYPTIGFTQPNTDFILDASGNLVRILSTSYSIYPVMPNAYVTPVADAQVSFAGGVAADYFKSADNSLTFGRWQGGNITIKDNAAVTSVVNPLLAADGITPLNASWYLFVPVAANYTQGLVGTNTYNKVAAVQPTDTLGNVGTLISATLSANFTLLTVDAAANLTIASKTFDLQSLGLPIVANAFSADPQYVPGAGGATGPMATTTCAGTACAASYQSRFGGIFLGSTASSVMVHYDIWPTTTANAAAADNVQGLIAFNTATAPTVGINPVTGTYQGGAFANVLVTGGAISAETKGSAQPNTNFILDASGNLVKILSTSYQEQPVMPNVNPTPMPNVQVSSSGGVAADYFKMADNSLTFGRWQGGNMTVKDNVTGISTVKPLLAADGITPLNSFWILLTPVVANYTQGLTGTAIYSNMAAVQPTDSLGNVGVLTSATLSANFTAMTVDATANLTIAAKTFNLSSLGLPIVADSFQANPSVGGGTGPMATTTCTGVTCATYPSYQSRFGGGFLGSTASSALVNYTIWPTTTAGAAAPYIIDGAVAFNTVTAPTVAPDAAYNPNHIAVETAGGFNNFNSGMLAAPAGLSYITGGTGNNSTSGALSSMTVSDIGGGSGWSQTTAITGGTATSANAPAYATTGIQYGAWTGYTGQSNTWSSLLGGKSGSSPTSWMYGPQGYLDTAYLSGPSVIGAMAGTFTYQMDGAPAPHSQNSGLNGTLTSASFTANFVSMQLNGNLALTMPGNENWGASVVNAPMVAGNTFSANPVVTYSVGAAAPLATCATCSGNVSGDFTGQNFAGSLMSYQLYNNSQTAGGDVSGNVALTRNYAGNTNPTVVDSTTAAPTGNIVVATDGNGGGSNVSSYPVANSTTTGNLLTAYGVSGGGAPFTSTYSTTVTCTTCTTNASGQVASSGIYYGNWSAGSITQSYSSTFTAGMMPPSYWITGPEAGPLYLPQALTGTASYAFNAGQVRNSMGVAGTVAGTTVLSLDFNKQTVSVNLDVSIASVAATPVVHTWNATTLAGNEAVLGNGQGMSGAGFYASTYANNGGGSGLLTVTVDGGATPVTVSNATVSGQLTGAGLTGAIISFNLDGTLNTALSSYEMINGVAAFTGTAANTATPHRYVATSFYDPFAPVPQLMLGFYANSSTRVTQDGTGNLTQFDTQFISANNGGSSMTFTSTPTAPAISPTMADYGTDAVSGISWGRWSGGTFNATDRKTSVVTPVAQLGSLHWIAEPVATAATTLPVVGTYTYIKAGNTLPTDNLGTVGTLNSATLTADFTAHTVNLGVNTTLAGATMNAVGTNVPIIQKTVFYASSQEPAASTSHLAVTCSGTCGATLGGTVIGKFTGAAAIGAAMTYGLQNGSSTISGVAAFHR